MKIRNGFVSNSSSSSFMIFGVGMNKNKLIATVEAYCKAKEQSFPNFEDEDEERLNDWIFQNIGLAVERVSYDDDERYIGKSWDSIKDDETGKQFKDKITDSLKAIGITKECTTITEAWYNG